MSQVKEVKEANSGGKPEIPGSRLCHVIKSPKFDGYGFNLHAEKSKPGQYIGKVDDGSPAEEAGLRQGDRILEVNGVNISHETHKQVVQRIKTNPNETKLLVLSPVDETTPTTPVTEKNSSPVPEKIAATPVNADIPSANNANNNANNTTNNHNHTEENAPPIGLKLNMTAAELRAQLANKKKYDPKKESIDFKKKFDIVQKL